MNDAVTVVIQHHVKPDAVPQYEAWLKEIARERSRFPGHMGVNVIRPHKPSTAYTVVLRFDSHEHLAGWIDSTTRRQLVDRAAPMLVDAESFEVHTGLEYWFTPAAVAPARAKAFKQFLVTLSAIYPLTQLVPKLLQPLREIGIFQAWPFLNGLAAAAVIVFLMVYVVMPRYTRWVASWLFR